MMIEYLKYKSISASRYCLVHTLSGLLSTYVINEYPRSGGTWIGEMVAKALGISFPRNDWPSLRSSILHGHYIQSWGMRDTLIVFRDGRDVIISWYYHCLFFNNIGNARLVRAVRNELKLDQPDDLMSNLPIFIEYSFTKQRHPRFTWSQFVRYWYGRPKFTYVRYEDMLVDTVGELKRVVKSLSDIDLSDDRASEIVDMFSFNRLSGRAAGNENKQSFRRKGIAGDWRNHFSKDASEMFEFYAGDELRMLGYEADKCWYNNL